MSRAIELAPINADFQVDRAEYWRELGNAAAELEDRTKAFEVEGDAVSAVNLAKCHLRQGRIEAAKEWFAKATELDSDASLWSDFERLLAAAEALAEAAAAAQAEQSPEGQQDTLNACQERLARLGKLFAEHSAGQGKGRPKYGGSAYWLWLRMRRSIPSGDESALLCPLDETARHPATAQDRTAWDNVDLRKPDRALCSYPGRDFVTYPLRREASDDVLSCCPHHPGKVLLLFADGRVETIDRNDASLPEDGELLIGPSSTHDQLKRLIWASPTKD